MLLTQIMAVLLGLAALILWLIAWRKSKRGQFYADSLLLFPLGIYVWGDGLILAPFWLILSIFFFFLSLAKISQILLVFYLVRSAYEVVYWINHQVAQKNYHPPLFRAAKWLGSNEAAILYQLIHTCVVVICLSLLLSGL